MFPRLLTTLVLASACAAHPLVNVVTRDSSHVSLVIAKRLNLTGPTNLFDHDRARARKLLAAANPSFNLLHTDVLGDGASSVELNNTLVSYVVQIGVGLPARNYDLIVDTGSSNTWVGADNENPWRPSLSSRESSRRMSVTYGTGSFEGKEVIDQVTIGNLIIRNQAIGAAKSSAGFDGVDGILGIGPTDLTAGTIEASDAEVPTVVDTAAQSKEIPSKIVGIYFQPPTSNGELNGVLTFGHADSSKFVGDLYQVPITSSSPANKYVGIDQTITYGSGGTTILQTSSGIVDTGTTLILLSTDAYNNYKQAVNATEDFTTGLLCISVDQYARLESLYFQIGSETFEFTANAQIWPRALNVEIGGTSDRVYLIIGDAGSTAGSGIDFINGQVFLERFYTTYDSANNKFGIARTEYTMYEGN